MASVEVKQGKNGQDPDLQLLGEMVGVQKSLQVLVDSNPQVGKEEILNLLHTQRVSFPEGTFEKKKQALDGIIKKLEEGTIQVNEVTAAAGVVRKEETPKRQGLFGRFRRG